MVDKIARAAIQYGDGHVISVPQPGRHHNCFRQAEREGRAAEAEKQQGFLTAAGRFVNRYEAWDIARLAGQLLPKAPTDGRGGELYSEDVW